ncbi:MAG: CvpA family protein [Kiritimatiellae bacterium]|jgi:uncharacterized membrane protein required for colicin V production|nr:CvpA family protein [Kiritimatiellia bacterium]
MNIPWIDAVILLAALVGAHTGRKRGLGRELWRILRRLFPAIFGLGLYTAMAAMLTKLPGVGSAASKFWGFVLIYGAVLILIHKGRSRFRDRFITWGNRKPDTWAAVAGGIRSLMGSALVVFVLSMFPVDAVREALINASWFARIFHRLF